VNGVNEAIASMVQIHRSLFFRRLYFAQRAPIASMTLSFNALSEQEVSVESISVSLLLCFFYLAFFFLFSYFHPVRSKHNLRFYAMKVLNKERIVKMKQVEHTNNEQRMLASVQHPFIINLWGIFQDYSNLYMVMDFVPGGELFTLLRRSNVR
jgi:serine/threonine protein kinase